MTKSLLMYISQTLTREAMDYDNDLFLSVANYLKDRDADAKMTHCTEFYPDIFIGTE